MPTIETRDIGPFGPLAIGIDALDVNFAVGEGEDRPRGRAADPGQCLERRVFARERAIVALGGEHRRAMQVARACVVAEAGPVLCSRA